MKEKDVFAKGIEQLRAEGFVPAQQMAVDATVADKNDWMSKMATKWKQVSEATEAKLAGVPVEHHPAPRVHSAPPRQAATMDLPADLMGGGRSPMMNESIDPREDDDYFERLQQAKLEQVRKKQQMTEYAQPQQQAPQYIQQPQYVQPQQQGGMLTEQRIAQVAETVIKDVVLNLYIEEKIKKVLSEGLSDERIAQVVKQTIRELRDGAAKKK